jgi:hypothetical protein
VVSPVRVRVSPLRNPDGIRVFFFRSALDEQLFGYPIGSWYPTKLALECRRPSVHGVSGTVRDEATTIPVVDPEVCAPGQMQPASLDTPDLAGAARQVTARVDVYAADGRTDEKL